MADRSLFSIRSLTAISASDTGDDAPLVQFLSSVRNSDSASAPASRTVSFSSAPSRAGILLCRLPALASAKLHSFDPQRRSIDAIAKFQIVGRNQRLESLKQMPRDRPPAHRIGDLAILDPEPGRAAAVVAGHAVDAGADQIGNVKSLADVRYQFSRRRLACVEMQVIRSRRRRRRYAALGVSGGDQPEFPPGRRIQ